MNPITRKEMFLASAGGQNVETPTPVTREEVFLDAIAKGGGGGGGSSGGGVLVVNLTYDPEIEGRVCDKTAGEIMAVADAGGSVAFKEAVENATYIEYLAFVEYSNGGYSFSGAYGSTYSATSASDYPQSGTK